MAEYEPDAVVEIEEDGTGLEAMLEEDNAAEPEGTVPTDDEEVDVCTTDEDASEEAGQRICDSVVLDELEG